jgi:YHS domain-containing protein
MLPIIKLAFSLIAVTTAIIFAGDSTSPKAETHAATHKTMGSHHYDASMPMSGQKATGTSSMKSDTQAALVPQTTCPVMGGAIDKKLYVDYQGKRIYMCCPGCKDAIAKNPEKYIKKLASMGQSVEIIDSALAKQSSAATTTKTPAKQTAETNLIPQKTCPVMGNPIDKTVFVDYKGHRVYFCCSMCPPKFKQDPEKYLKKLNDLGETPEVIGTK